MWALVSGAIWAVGAATTTLRSSASIAAVESVQFVYDADGNRVGERRISVDPGSGQRIAQDRKFLVDPSHPSGWSQSAAILDDGRLRQVPLLGLHPAAVVSPADPEGPSRTYFLADGSASTRITLTAAAGEPEGAASSHWSEPQVFDAFGTRVGLTAPEGTEAGNWEVAEPIAGEIHAYRGEAAAVGTGLTYLRARWYAADLGRFLTGDAFEGELELPTSQHRFVYAGNDPINRLDPSGYFTLLELDLVQGIQTTIRSLEAQTPRVALQAARLKLWEVHLGMKLKLFSKVPLHASLFVENRITREGIRYEVGVRGEKTLFRTTLGGIRRRPASWAGYKRMTTWTMKVAHLNSLQFLAWDRSIGFLDADTTMIPIDYSVFGATLDGPGPTNCAVWAIEAAVAAWAASKIGN